MPIMNVSGHRVRVPKGQRDLNGPQRDALSALLSSRKLKNDKSCTIVFFMKEKKGGKALPSGERVAVQRCESRNGLTGPTAVARGKRIARKCEHYKSGPHKGQFKSCS